MDWGAGFLFRKRRVIFLTGAMCLVSFLARAELWSTAYYPGWEQGSMPASQIDFPAVTHIIHFAVLPNADGSLNSSANSVTAQNSTDIVAKAHAAGKKVLICVGGASTSFQSATSPPNLPAFLHNLTNFMSARGYDGIDVDWEPLVASDATQYTNLVNALRSALDKFPAPKLLTTAVPAYSYYADPPNTLPVMLASVQHQFDQINLMTYDLSGPYDGWVTWFNSPMYDGGYGFPSTGGLVPSVNGAVNNFISHGVSPAKLGIGIAFYGYVWSGGAGTSTGGASQPRQNWTSAPVATALSYKDIMATHYQTNLYRWDNAALAAYLTINDTGSINDKFISYDDERTCQSKISFARNRGLGGVMIWQLAQDHQAGQPGPLLQSVKRALSTPGPMAIQSSGSNINLSFTSIPLGSYRVQWTGKNLPATNWNTLLVTNVSGTGGVMHVTDPGAANREQARFYRVKTPQ